MSAKKEDDSPLYVGSTGGPKPEGGQVYVVGVDTTEKSLAAFYYALKKSQPNDQIKVFYCDKIDIVIDDGLFAHLKERDKKEAINFFEGLKAECKAYNVCLLFCSRLLKNT